MLQFRSYRGNKPTIGQSFSRNTENPWNDNRYVSPLTEDPGIVIQEGSGAVSTIATIQALIKAAPVVVKGLDKVVFGKIGTDISNTLGEKFSKNEEWRPGFPGEHHAILPTSSGLARANYAGPGTHLGKRLRRGDRPVDGEYGVDAAAQLHDIRYATAKNTGDIRKADNLLIRDVANSTQSKLVKNSVIGTIRAKKFGENIGLFSQSKWVPKGNMDDGNIGSGCNPKPAKPPRKKKRVYPATILAGLNTRKKTRGKKK